MTYSTSPTGEQFPLPAREDYAAEFARIENLAHQARAEGKEVVVVMGPNHRGTPAPQHRSTGVSAGQYFALPSPHKYGQIFRSFLLEHSEPIGQNRSWKLEAGR
jgi:hypothetical protein